MRFKEFRKRFNSLKSKEAKDNLASEFVREKTNRAVGCLVILIFIAVFIGVIALIVAMLRFIF